MDNINAMIEELESSLEKSKEKLNNLKEKKNTKEKELDLINEELDCLNHPEKYLQKLGDLLIKKKQKALKFGAMIFLFLMLGFSVVNIALVLTDKFAVADFLIALSVSTATSTLSGFIAYLDETDKERKQKKDIRALDCSKESLDFSNKLKKQSSLEQDISLIDSDIKEEIENKNEIEKELNRLRGILRELTMMLNPEEALEVISYQKKLGQK